MPPNPSSLIAISFCGGYSDLYACSCSSGDIPKTSGSCWKLRSRAVSGTPDEDVIVLSSAVTPVTPETPPNGLLERADDGGTEDDALCACEDRPGKLAFTSRRSRRSSLYNSRKEHLILYHCALGVLCFISSFFAKKLRMNFGIMPSLSSPLPSSPNEPSVYVLPEDVWPYHSMDQFIPLNSPSSNGLLGLLVHAVLRALVAKHVVEGEHAVVSQLQRVLLGEAADDVAALGSLLLGDQRPYAQGDFDPVYLGAGDLVHYRLPAIVLAASARRRHRRSVSPGAVAARSRARRRRRRRRLRRGRQGAVVQVGASVTRRVRESGRVVIRIGIRISINTLSATFAQVADARDRSCRVQSVARRRRRMRQLLLRQVHLHGWNECGACRCHAHRSRAADSASVLLTVHLLLQRCGHSGPEALLRSQSLHDVSRRPYRQRARRWRHVSLLRAERSLKPRVNIGANLTRHGCGGRTRIGTRHFVDFRYVKYAQYYSKYGMIYSINFKYSESFL